MALETRLDEIRTSVAGTNSGPERAERQQALGQIAQIMAETGQPFFLDLVPDPENKWDPNALQLIANLPEMGGRFLLGYVRNRPGCDYCNREFTATTLQIGDTCPNCLRGQIQREGLATRLSTELRKNEPGVSYYAEVMEITGGVGEKTLRGCNIVIRRYAERS